MGNWLKEVSSGVVLRLLGVVELQEKVLLGRMAFLVFVQVSVCVMS